MAWLKGPRGSGDAIEVNDPVRFMQTAEFMDDNPMGDTYYVHGGETSYTGIGSNDNAGTSPGTAWLTLSYAVSQAGDWDKIIVLPSDNCSTYFEAEADLPITITQTGLKIIGGLTSERQWGSPALHTHGTTSFIYVNAHQVEIAHVAFHIQGAAPAAVEIAQNDNYWRTHIHDCYFGGNAACLTGIVAGNVTGSGYGYGSTVDAPCTTIERCYFNYMATTGIYIYAGYGSTVRNCAFDVQAANYGIVVGNSTTSRPYLWIDDNKFTTIDASNAVGINVVNTPTLGYFAVDGNRFFNFADGDHCCSKRTGYFGVNYNNATLLSATTGG